MHYGDFHINKCGLCGLRHNDLLSESPYIGTVNLEGGYMLTEEQKVEVKKLWLSCGPLASSYIAKKLGLTKEYVQKYVKSLNLEHNVSFHEEQ